MISSSKFPHYVSNKWLDKVHILRSKSISWFPNSPLMVEYIHRFPNPVTATYMIDILTSSFASLFDITESLFFGYLH